ncbi:MAG: ferritin-like domain-containing protein [Nannocystales bacterium]
MDRLQKVFAGLLAASAIGCTPKSDAEPGLDLDQFSLDLCSDGDLRPLMAVQPADAVEYMELREATANQFDPLDPPSQGQVTDSDGEKCGGASDADACASEFGMLPYESELLSGGGFSDVWVHTTLAFTRGDEVGLLASTADIQAFLGEIDAPGDAALWAKIGGHAIVCGPGDDVGEHAEGHVLHTTTGSGCPDDVVQHVVLVRADGSIEVLDSEVVEEGEPGCSVGRLPRGYCRNNVRRGVSPVGRALVAVAEMEAAAVPAFEQLGRELRAHGAPTPFVGEAERARLDEVRHARTMARLARRHGGLPRAPRVRRMPLKDMVSVVAENAAEGCVRETFGALVAHAQARRAQDPALRHAMRTIARDETRHARLSWAIDGWARSRMKPGERARVARSARHSIERLREELTPAQDPSVHTVLGLPEPAEARSMFAGLHAGVLHELEV